MPDPLNTPMPWHADVWQRTQARRRANQLPHALLLSGAAGVGKRRFAEALAQSLLCAKPDASGIACGTCPPCRLFIAGSHPDVMRIGVLEDKTEIGVDQIRELRDFVALSAFGGGHKIIVIDPADRMNVNSANALLKTLEEPGGRALLMLVTTRESRLPATVRSRCQRLEFALPARDAALAWLRGNLEGEAASDASAVLALALGAPLRALELYRSGAVRKRAQLLEELRAIAQGKEDPVAVAARWYRDGMKDAWPWLNSCAIDVARLKFHAPSSLLTNVDAAPILQEFAQRIEVQPLFHWSDRVRKAQSEADSQLNQQMVLEDVLIAWERLFAQAQKTVTA